MVGTSLAAKCCRRDSKGIRFCAELPLQLSGFTAYLRIDIIPRRRFREPFSRRQHIIYVKKHRSRSPRPDKSRSRFSIGIACPNPHSIVPCDSDCPGVTEAIARAGFPGNAPKRADKAFVKFIRPVQFLQRIESPPNRTTVRKRPIGWKIIRKSLIISRKQGIDFCQFT